MRTERDVWEIISPEDIWVMDKLILSRTLGYICGPSGMDVPKPGWYIVRPCVNIRGLGLGAEKKWLDRDTHHLPIGSFWCEWFEGRQYSVTYRWDEWSWIPVSCWEGIKDDENLSKFHKWIRTDHYPPLGILFHELSDLEMINVEYIEDKPIEVHLRTSPNPDYNELIPVWKGQEKMVDKHIDMG
jgi:hypothetical protein